MATVRDEILDQIKRYRKGQEARARHSAELLVYADAAHHSSKADAAEDIAMLLHGVLQDHGL